jgi:putative transposase
VPNYRRAYSPGGTFFFTQVTYRRMQVLCLPLARSILRRSMMACKTNHPFTIVALVLLTDHLHTIWTLPEDDADFSTRWSIYTASAIRMTSTGIWIMFITIR